MTIYAEYKLPAVYNILVVSLQSDQIPQQCSILISNLIPMDVPVDGNGQSGKVITRCKEIIKEEQNLTIQS